MGTGGGLKNDVSIPIISDIRSEGRLRSEGPGFPVGCERQCRVCADRIGTLRWMRQEETCNSVGSGNGCLPGQFCVVPGLTCGPFARLTAHNSVGLNNSTPAKPETFTFSLAGIVDAGGWSNLDHRLFWAGVWWRGVALMGVRFVSSAMSLVFTTSCHRLCSTSGASTDGGALDLHLVAATRNP